MIKKDSLKALETALGMPEGEITKLWNDTEEKEIPIATVEIIPKADYTTRIDNISKAKYDEGKIAGVETTVKEIKNGLGLDVTKTTPIAELIPAIKTKVIADAKIPEADKVRELNQDIITLKGQNTTLTNELTGLKTTYKQKEDSRKIITTVLGALPKAGDKAGELILPGEDAAALTLQKASATGINPSITDEGTVVWKKADGSIMKDANLVPMQAGAVLKDFFQPYVRPAGGGGGGGDNTGQDKKGGMQAFIKEMELAGVPMNSQKFNQEMIKRIGDKTLDPNIK